MVANPITSFRPASILQAGGQAERRIRPSRSAPLALQGANPLAGVESQIASAFDTSGVGRGNRMGKDQIASLLGRAAQAVMGGFQNSAAAQIGGLSAEVAETSVASKATEDVMSGKPLSQVNFQGLAPKQVKEIVGLKKEMANEHLLSLKSIVDLKKQMLDLDFSPAMIETNLREAESRIKLNDANAGGTLTAGEKLGEGEKDRALQSSLASQSDKLRRDLAEIDVTSLEGIADLERTLRKELHKSSISQQAAALVAQHGQNPELMNWMSRAIAFARVQGEVSDLLPHEAFELIMQKSPFAKDFKNIQPKNVAPSASDDIAAALGGEPVDSSGAIQVKNNVSSTATQPIVKPSEDRKNAPSYRDIVISNLGKGFNTTLDQLLTGASNKKELIAKVSKALGIKPNSPISPEQADRIFSIINDEDKKPKKQSRDFKFPSRNITVGNNPF
jgi:hypothetical protein